MSPLLRADGRWQVRVPRKRSSSGRRASHYFHSRTAAEKFIKSWKNEHREHGRAAVSAEERHWINVARTELGDLGKLRDVLDHYARTAAGVQPMPAVEAVAQFLEYRLADRLNPETKKDIQWRLRAFGRHFGFTPMHHITAGDVERWLRTYTEGWARHSMFKRARVLFAHAVRNHWLLENPFDLLKPPETPGVRKDVYTPDEYYELLSTAVYSDNAVTAYLALSGMAFCRHQELVRRYKGENVLEWRDVMLDRNELHIREEVGKAARRKGSNERWTPIHPALKRWLEYCHKYRNPNDPRVVDCSEGDFRKRLGEVFRHAKVRFIQNGLRHSAISHWIAAHEFGVAQVAQWAGQSEQTCRRHYLKILTKEDGLRWFETAKG